MVKWLDVFCPPSTVHRQPFTKVYQAKPTYHSKIYRDFRAIDGSEWRTVVRFYEEFEKDIRVLDFPEYFELLQAYAKALFEIGAYEKYLLMVDVVIEASVDNNIKFFKGEDVFHQLLFKKAASFYHTHELGKAEYILRELLRIDPFDGSSALFLKKCLRKTQPAFLRNARAAAILLFLFSALLICIEVLVIRNFYHQYTHLMEVSRNSVFFSGFALLAGSDLYHRGRTGKEVDDFVAAIRRKKRKQSI
ncbi:MAG: hypothetical protein H6577_06795 [Lewinellaceae bacterium]|nr:hypothetical protein [Saprospiraceae bacterium]MCB9337817.1 hypothetical protein [Lewinellaceae bacterium]